MLALVDLLFHNIEIKRRENLWFYARAEVDWLEFRIVFFKLFCICFCPLFLNKGQKSLISNNQISPQVKNIKIKKNYYDYC